MGYWMDGIWVGDDAVHRRVVDMVGSPPHYAEGWSNGAEVIDITEHLSFALGNVVKYAARAGKKPGADALEDLRKSRWYLDREIKRLESQRP